MRIPEQPTSLNGRVHCLSFPEEADGDTEESHLSWLPASLRKPLVSGCSISHTAAFVLVFLLPSYYSSSFSGCVVSLPLSALSCTLVQ